jgi:hypothetical protein
MKDLELQRDLLMEQFEKHVQESLEKEEYFKRELGRRSEEEALRRRLLQ